MIKTSYFGILTILKGLGLGRVDRRIYSGTKGASELIVALAQCPVTFEKIPAQRHGQGGRMSAPRTEKEKNKDDIHVHGTTRAAYSASIST